ncbi:hypothetical protein Q5M85_23205 [Paraclostridium bifermentans]|nr:hypothetical protein [Paraclostridium bifermentans]
MNQQDFKGIFNFINFVKKLKRSNSDMGSAKTLGRKCKCSKNHEYT